MTVSAKPGWTLFLDFDGVLNNDPFLRYQRNHVAPLQWRLFDPANLRALDQLWAALPVETIVATSSWRLGRDLAELRELFVREGSAVSHLMQGTTSSIGPDPEDRAGEILAYVAEHQVARWLVLDDFGLQHVLGSRFFRVSQARGLVPDLVDQIVAAQHLDAN